MSERVLWNLDDPNQAEEALNYFFSLPDGGCNSEAVKRRRPCRFSKGLYLQIWGEKVVLKLTEYLGNKHA